jgi:hypothetical protein
MIYSLKDLDGFKLAATDGLLGRVKEANFDEREWAIRYLVADTGTWFSGRRVLLSPQSLGRLDPEHRRLEVALSRQQIEQAPGVETDLPASRRRNLAVAEADRYPSVWEGSGRWSILEAPLAGGVTPAASELDPSVAREVVAAEREAANPNLRSSADTIGYRIVARDGDIGHIADFLVDLDSWQIRLAVVDTHNWLAQRLVLVSPRWIERIDWSARRAVVSVSREAIANSPRYERDMPLSEEGVERVQRHFEASE